MLDKSLSIHGSSVASTPPVWLLLYPPSISESNLAAALWCLRDSNKVTVLAGSVDEQPRV